ncbi:bifunctional DNA primase/polymerase [Streptomyces sp. NPDC048491]|uniref:bifunctional DNA primase/polymerase n=1 Tax=Streptomyces sp. NPDC048491 TaxID=3157207 RepID=UPI0034390FFC
MSTLTTDVEAAVRAAGRGLALFPLPAGGRVPAPGWHEAATTDPAALVQLLADGANVGVGCRASGVVVLDLDVHGDEDGPGALAAFAERVGLRLPETFTVGTPSGGRHLYYRAPDGCTIGSVSGGRTPLGPGIDVRGPGLRRGGYLVGPGSVVGGQRYVIAHDVPVAPLPVWIGALLPRPEDGPHTSRLRFAVESFGPDRIKPGVCNCACRVHHFHVHAACDGTPVREAEVTWVSVMTGEAAEPRVEAMCSPCYDAVAVRLARQARINAR